MSAEPQMNANTHWEWSNTENRLASATIVLGPTADEQILRHELAHVLQRFRHGPDVAVHGVEFDEALFQLGAA